VHLEISESTRMAFDSLRQHKMRSLLTVLGVVIGIMAIVAVASIMVGLDRIFAAFSISMAPTRCSFFAGTSVFEALSRPKNATASR
jgi:ABC-type antimicrobial peptide transport system permease subunit